MGVIAGINMDSVTAKTVIMEESRKILSHSIVEEGIVNEASAKLSLTRALGAKQPDSQETSGIWIEVRETEGSI